MNYKFIVHLVLITLTAASFLGCKDKPQPSPAEPANTTQQPAAKDLNTVPPQAPQSQANPHAAAEPNTADSQPAQAAPDSKPTLESIVADSRKSGWEPSFTEWYGKMAPDFTLTDITGKSHKLSDYRGKKVMLVFWATWCPPCLQEIPSLIELRKTVSEDKLTILAITAVGYRSTIQGVKKFVAANPVINYPVIAVEPDSLPNPYNSINAIPSAFFINPDGKIKIVTEGAVPFSQIKAILDAQQ